MESTSHRICVSICEKNSDDLANAIVRAAEVGDMIEIRLDCLNQDFKSGLDQIKKLLPGSVLPVIITFRPAEQGGASDATHETRYAFWNKQGLELPSLLSDLELDIAERFASASDVTSERIDWSRIVCSYHDFRGRPADLEQIYDRVAAVPARIVKIAVAARDAIDCLGLFQLLDRALRERREMIAIAMGPAGLATRILGPSRGAFLTYGALDEKTATGPGQITAQDLKTVYRVDRIDLETQIMGLVGLPVVHSVSPHMHNAAFAFASINAVYIPFEVHDLGSFFKRMIDPRTREMKWNLRGLSITAPHKTAVLDHLDWIEPSAREIGSVNTVVAGNGELHGYNTDSTAFTQTLIGKIGSLNQARVALIGAGGAASAALHGLNQQGASTTIFAREIKRAKDLVERFGVKCESLDGAGFDGFDVVVNATPLGTAGEFEGETPAAGHQLRGARLAYDLVYNPTETRFLREAREAGCATLGGLSMLIEQAMEQFRLWTGAVVPESVMYEAAERRLKRT